MGIRKIIHSLNLMNHDLVIAKMEIPLNNELYVLGVGTAIDKEMVRNMVNDEYAQAVAINNYELGINKIENINLSHQFFAVQIINDESIIAIDSKDPLFNRYQSVSNNNDISVLFKKINWNNCDVEDKKYILDMYHNFLNEQPVISNSYRAKEFIAVDDYKTGLLIPIDPESEFFDDYQGNIPYIHGAKISYKPIDFNNLSEVKVKETFDLYRKYLHRNEKNQVFKKRK